MSFEEVVKTAIAEAVKELLPKIMGEVLNEVKQKQKKVEKFDERLLNEKEAAEMLGVSTKLLQAWRYRREGVPFVKVGRRVKYRLRDIQDYIERNKEHAI